MDELTKKVVERVRTAAVDPDEIEIDQSGHDETMDFKIRPGAHGYKGLMTVVGEPGWDFWQVQDVKVQPKRVGLGSLLYDHVAAVAKRHGAKLMSDDPHLMTGDATAFWKAQVARGVAKRTRLEGGTYYVHK